jgi:hypothetical protein
MFKSVEEIDLGWLQDNHKLIHYFGLGFIQLKINDQYRLHFYTGQLPGITSKEDIHNHRYDFESKILHGTLTQEIFERTRGKTHTLRQESCNEEPAKETKGKLCSFRLAGIQTLSKGSSYFISHETFHRIHSINAITLLKRTPQLKEFADVISPVNSKIVCPFQLKVDEPKLWLLVEEMLTSARSQ